MAVPPLHRPSLGLEHPSRAQSYAGYSSLPSHLPQEISPCPMSHRSAESQRPQRPQTLFLSPSYSHTLGQSYALSDGGPSRQKMIRSVSAIGQPSLAMENETATWRASTKGDTPLDKTINAIGMGRYQYTVLVLTGCGYACDNAWLQGVAIALPSVQKVFDVSDSHIGLLSSCTFAGMMFGAFAWGTWSDTNGRAGPFNMTLLCVTIFGYLSAFASSFPMLCFILFCLGLGLGGSIPTDGLVFAENLPTEKRYLLTSLSVFFSLGSVLSSILGLLIIPGSTSNWRWFLGCLAILTTLFVILRLVFFRLMESPRYLASFGKYEEARVALQKIAAFNGSPLPVSLTDVRDVADGQNAFSHNEPQGFGHHQKTRGGYSAVASNEESEEGQGSTADGEADPDEVIVTTIDWLPDWSPPWIVDSLSPLLAKYSGLFDDEWQRTTVLVWGIWITVSLAYTMFNVFLPKYLESRMSSPAGPADMKSVMQNYLLYAIASLPGSLVGGWMVETRLGRKGTMAASLALTALELIIFIMAGPPFIIVSSMLISLTATIAYAALYAYTPEVFETTVRGTASGTASALSRLAGIVAPVLAGSLLSVSLNLPLMLSVVLFLLASAMCIALPIETRRVREAASRC